MSESCSYPHLQNSKIAYSLRAFKMYRRLFLNTIALFCATALLHAEEPIAEQPVPFAVWLDFPALARPGAEPPPLPIWFESFQDEALPARDNNPPSTRYRLRLRRIPYLHKELLLRLFFDDVPGMQPVVSVWSETGKNAFRSEPLGASAGLPTNQTVVIPLTNADYVDIEVAGDGSSIRGAFVSSLKDATVSHTIDFKAPPQIIDPFENLPSTELSQQDSKLFGRVKAPLDREMIHLAPNAATAETWQLELATQPLMAMLTFEVLNADMQAAPLVTVNESAAAPAHIHFPDLADPGYRGQSQSLNRGMRFQYTGWLRAQVIVPGNALRSGLNKVTISLSQESGAVAIRNLELQLKQNWKYLDYTLSPKNP
jgi:hypothetical protein